MKKGKRKLYLCIQKLIGAIFIALWLLAAGISLGGKVFAMIFIPAGLYMLFTKELFIRDAKFFRKDEE